MKSSGQSERRRENECQLQAGTLDIHLGNRLTDLTFWAVQHDGLQLAGRQHKHWLKSAHQPLIRTN